MINKVFPFVLLCSMFSPLGTFQEKILVNLTSQSSKVLTDFEGIKRLETQQVEKVSSQKYFPEDALTYESLSSNSNTLEFINRPTYNLKVDVGIETANEEASNVRSNEAFLLQYILDVHRFRPIYDKSSRDKMKPSYLIVDKVIKCSNDTPLDMTSHRRGERGNK